MELKVEFLCEVYSRMTRMWDVWNLSNGLEKCRLCPQNFLLQNLDEFQFTQGRKGD